MAEEPEDPVLKMLRGLRAEMAAMRDEMAATRTEITATRAEMATKSDLASARADVRSDIRSLRADVAFDLHEMQARSDRQFKSVHEEIGGLRRTLEGYHAVVVGHGVLYGELETRVHRVERRLELPPIESD